jgi:hypothetical protein
MKFQVSAPPLAAGYLLSVICDQQEAATLIQEKTGEWVVGRMIICPLGNVFFLRLRPLSFCFLVLGS